MPNDYHEQAANFLAKGGIVFTAALIGSDCPLFCEDARKGVDLDKVDTYPRKTHIHGKHYRCTFSRAVDPNVQRPAIPLVIDFWNSYADEEINALGTRGFREGSSVFKFGRRGSPKLTPQPYDVLACIEKNEQGSFQDWCDELGYDTDSRRAHSVYELCCEQYRCVRAFFTDSEMEELREIQ